MSTCTAGRPSMWHAAETVWGAQTGRPGRPSMSSWRRFWPRSGGLSKSKSVSGICASALLNIKSREPEGSPDTAPFIWFFSAKVVSGVFPVSGMLFLPLIYCILCTEPCRMARPAYHDAQQVLHLPVILAISSGHPLHM